MATLWETADRLAGVANCQINSTALKKQLDMEARRLRQLSRAARQAREGLAAAMFRGGCTGEYDLSIIGLQLIGEQARDFATR